MVWKTAFKKFTSKKFKGCLLQILLGSFLNTLTHFSQRQSHLIDLTVKMVFLCEECNFKKFFAQ